MSRRERPGQQKEPRDSTLVRRALGRGREEIDKWTHSGRVFQEIEGNNKCPEGSGVGVCKVAGMANAKWPELG